MAQCPSINDRDHDLLKKIAANTCELAGGTGSPITVDLEVNGAPVSTSNPLPIDGSAVVTGLGYTASFTQTRPDNATPYTGGDVVGEDPGENLEFAGIGPESFTAFGAKIIITRVKLRIDVNAVPAGMTQFRLHLYDSGPTVIADNAPYNLPAADRDKYLGYIELATPIDLGDTIYSGTEDANYPVRFETRVNTLGNLYGILQTVGGYTPSALTVKTVTLYSVSV